MWANSGQKEQLYTKGGNVNYHCYYGNQYGDFVAIFDAIGNGNVYLNSFSGSLLLVCRKIK